MVLGLVCHALCWRDRSPWPGRTVELPYTARRLLGWQCFWRTVCQSYQRHPELPLRFCRLSVRAWPLSSEQNPSRLPPASPFFIDVAEMMVNRFVAQIERPGNFISIAAPRLPIRKVIVFRSDFARGCAKCLHNFAGNVAGHGRGSPHPAILQDGKRIR